MSGLRLRAPSVLAVRVLATAGAVAALLTSCSTRRAAVHTTPAPTTSLATIENAPHIVFRNTALGNSYGMVAMVALSSPGGQRALTTTPCDRVYAAAANILCLSSKVGVTTTYQARVLTESFAAIRSLPLSGIPSRARLSADGALAATTSFVAGDSYEGASFSTRTLISTVNAGTTTDLEKFTLIHHGSAIAPVDRNFWGVTFGADGDTFYVTVEWSHHTWLARGSVARRTMVTLHEDAECPSVSPDGRSVVFKQRADLPAGRWRLVRYDVASGSITPLAESRSVDDQVEWLDDEHVIYGLPRAGSQAAVDDVWTVASDGTGTPRILIPQAWSPAVVR